MRPMKNFSMTVHCLMKYMEIDKELLEKVCVVKKKRHNRKA